MRKSPRRLGARLGSPSFSGGVKGNTYTYCAEGGRAWERGYIGTASLVPRPPPSSVRNARAQFNAGVEKRREKAWTNFTRDPRHRRHKCLTRNSVTYSVLAMRVYVQLETSSQRISSLSGRRERGESRTGNSTGNSAELRD